jgi:chromosome segregation ATPase
MEREARLMKNQLEELTRTATDYASMLKRKESDIGQLLADMDQIHLEHEAAQKHIAELQAQVATLEDQLEVQATDKQRDNAARHRLQKEIDELRNVMAAKASEDTRRTEVHRSREKELTNLRAQYAKLTEELDELRRTSTESQARLKLELDDANHNRVNLEQVQKELAANQAENIKRRESAEATLAEVQRVSRSMESEVRLLKERSSKLEAELAETVKGKEVGISSFPRSACITFLIESATSISLCTIQVSRLRRCCAADRTREGFLGPPNGEHAQAAEHRIRQACPSGAVLQKPQRGDRQVEGQGYQIGEGAQQSTV